MGRNERFEQLMEMAQDGDACAVGDLWLEFGYRFPVGAEGDSHDID